MLAEHIHWLSPEILYCYVLLLLGEGGEKRGDCQETTTGEQAKIQVSVRTFVHVAAYCSL